MNHIFFRFIESQRKDKKTNYKR